MNKRGSMQKNQRGSMSGPPGSMQGMAPMVINIPIKKEELHHAKDAWKPNKIKGDNDKSEVSIDQELLNCFKILCYTIN